MTHRLLRAEDAYWRESNQMRVLNTDLAKQLEATRLGARLWRLRPGEASTRHRHAEEEELYVLLEGRGRIRIGDDAYEFGALDAMLVEPRTVRQLFNDTEVEALWLVVGAPPGPANTLEMTEAQLRDLYPDGPRALPPELGGGQFTPPS
ncbi:MAG TPA: cupin domain-containing protein [Solirubrobacterales bacterium]